MGVYTQCRSLRKSAARLIPIEDFYITGFIVRYGDCRHKKLAAMEQSECRAGRLTIRRDFL